mmetsp:Transcript_45764/g.97600  ORF Transcript_45764/g.97600 Transcript_45764/m.97600 type:complete len:263 (-) Transcript_45764:383-1171(-)
MRRWRGCSAWVSILARPVQRSWRAARTCRAPPRAFLRSARLRSASGVSGGCARSSSASYALLARRWAGILSISKDSPLCSRSATQRRSQLRPCVAPKTTLMPLSRSSRPRRRSKSCRWLCWSGWIWRHASPSGHHHAQQTQLARGCPRVRMRAVARCLARSALQRSCRAPRPLRGPTLRRSKPSRRVACARPSPAPRDRTRRWRCTTRASRSRCTWMLSVPHAHEPHSHLSAREWARDDPPIHRFNRRGADSHPRKEPNRCV